MTDATFGKPIIVIDPGSCTTKAGFAGYASPIVSISSVISRAKYKPAMPSLQYHEHFIGDNAQRMRSISSLKYPICNGMIKDKNDVELLFRHLYDDLLQADSSEHPVLIAEPILNSKVNKEIYTQMMFESFNSPSLYLAQKPVLSLYAAGKVNGCILYSGEGVTSVMCVCEGYSLNQSSQRVNFGGLDVINHLLKELVAQGISFSTSAEVEMGRHIKEKLCYISEDPEQELTQSLAEAKIFTLPDGRTISLKNERFLIPEILFQPKIVGKSDLGIHDMVQSAIAKADIELHKILYSHLVLAGGNTLFPGFQQRLRKELISDINQNVLTVKMIAPVERRHSVWLGGSILGSLSDFRKKLITKSEYEEIGSEIVHRKCLF